MERLEQWPQQGVLNITIVGAGNLGHVLAGQFGARPEINVRVLTKKADAVREGMCKHGITVTRNNRDRTIPPTTLVGRVDAVSDKAADVVPGSDFILITLPSNFRPLALQEIIPNVSKDKPVFIGAMPGIGGFDWIARQECDRVGASNVVLFSIKDIPFMSTAAVPGKSVTNLGPKKNLFLAVDKGKHSREMALVSRVITDLSDDTPCVLLDSFMTITLTPGNPIMHPAIMYGMFGPYSQWDGKPVKEKSLIYETVSELSCYFLNKADEEVQAIKIAVARETGADLQCVWPLRVNQKMIYGDTVKDNRTLMLALRTNRAYNDIRTPLKKVAGGFEPDYSHRFFVEDMPFGLVILRDIADLVGVETPMLDELLRWGQGLMGKEYLVDGKLSGHDMSSTGAPSRFGFYDINDLVWGKNQNRAKL